MTRRPRPAPAAVGVDATPLLGQRSGVGNYVRGLLDGFLALEAAPELLLTLFSIRGQLPDDVPTGGDGRLRAAPRRAPARLLQRAWARRDWPPVELLTGPIGVFHGTNFVLPPAAAAGVVTIHDLAYLRYADTVTGDAAGYARLVPRALARGAHVVAVSRAMADEIAAEYRLDPTRITVAHHGVDRRWAAAAPPDAARSSRWALPERYLLFAGNLEPRKNLGLLLRAHRAARRSDPSVPRLVLVGPAGWGDRWQGATPDPEDVVLTGYLPDDDLHSVVAGATAVCMPSHYEGFGLPVLEALAAGRPVLASDIAAHREISGGLATLLAADDVDGWTDALVRTTDPGPDDTAADARRAHAVGFTWTASAAAHARAYAAAAHGG